MTKLKQINGKIDARTHAKIKNSALLRTIHTGKEATLFEELNRLLDFAIQEGKIILTK